MIARLLTMIPLLMLTQNLFGMEQQPKETIFDEEDKRPLPKIEPKGFVPPNLNNPKKVVGDGMYDPNWDRPRFVKEKEAVDTYDDDDDDYLYAPIDDSIPV